MRKNGVLRLAACLSIAMLWSCASAQMAAPRLALIPPSPVTDRITIDIRGAVENLSDRRQIITLALYLDQESPSTLVRMQSQQVYADGNAAISYRRSMRGWTGFHRVILVARWPSRETRLERELRVVPSTIRSTRTIDGAWAGIVHWSEEEGKHWNADLRKLTEDDWREQIRGMHGIGMDTVVIQEVFRNEAYYGKHDISTNGYHGLAYYPSDLYLGRVPMTSHDPIEAILSEADRLKMNVFLGVGAYA